MGHLTLLRGGAGVLPGHNATGVQADLVANVRRRPRVTAELPVIPLYDHEAEPVPEAVFVPLSPDDWSLILSALVERGQGNSLRPGSQAHADLAVEVREAVRSRTMHPAAAQPGAVPAVDVCDPYGVQRLW